eukprot:g1543.t1
MLPRVPQLAARFGSGDGQQDERELWRALDDKYGTRAVAALYGREEAGRGAGSAAAAASADGAAMRRRHAQGQSNEGAFAVLLLVGVSMLVVATLLYGVVHTSARHASHGAEAGAAADGSYYAALGLGRDAAAVQ